MGKTYWISFNLKQWDVDDEHLHILWVVQQLKKGWHLRKPLSTKSNTFLFFWITNNSFLCVTVWWWLWWRERLWLAICHCLHTIPWVMRYMSTKMLSNLALSLPLIHGFISCMMDCICSFDTKHLLNTTPSNSLTHHPVIKTHPLSLPFNPHSTRLALKTYRDSPYFSLQRLCGWHAVSWYSDRSTKIIVNKTSLPSGYTMVWWGLLMIFR